jgi:hypothetical protein
MDEATSEYRMLGLYVGGGLPITIFIDNWRYFLKYSRNHEVMYSLSTQFASSRIHEFVAEGV